MAEISLKDFLSDFKDILEKKVLEATKPLHNVLEEDELTRVSKERLHKLLRAPYPRQTDAILALYKGFKAGKKSLILSAEMGSGKTLMALATAYLWGAKKVLVMCPGHLVRKWIREAQELIPGVKTVNLNSSSLKDLIELKNSRAEEAGMTVYVIGKERAKLHYAVKRAVDITSRHQIKCPVCGHLISDEKVLAKLQKNRRAKCPECKTPLYQPDKPRRYAKSEFIKRYLKGFFDLFIADEVHELKGGSSAQGQAFANFVTASKRTLALTGTLMGGYATNLYYIFWRMFPSKMKELGYEFYNASKFAEDYGIVETTVREIIEDEEGEYSISRSRNKKIYKKEKPGMSPALLTDFLLENTVFMKLGDIANSLPPYREFIVNVEMDEEQKEVYKNFESRLGNIVRRALARKDRSYLGILVQSLLALPDGARRGEEVYNPHDKAELVLTAEPIDIDILPKEQEMIDVISKEVDEGRKVLVCLEHTGTRDLTGELKERIEDAGYSVAILKSNTVKPELREEWIAKKVEDKDNPIDVLITNARIIQTGLDLLDFPTIIFFQTGYSVYTLRQASRRSWRIGQDKEVRVYYLAYADTMQERALKLMASKMESALALEGDLSDKGLVALSESESSILFELARTLLPGEKNNINDKSIKDLWNMVKTEETENDDFIGENINEEVEETRTENTVVKRNGKVVSDVTVKTKVVARGRIYPKNGIGVAFVGNHKFIFKRGKVYYKDRIVGTYSGVNGEINSKPIRIVKVKGKNYYVLCEIKKDVA